jgi:transcriptional regulator with GAF, ATPase, and Fis domain
LPSEAVLDALEMMLIGAPLNEVLTIVTRLIEAHSKGMSCSICLLDEDGLHLRRVVAAKLHEAYQAATDRVRIGPDVGSCGAAAYLRQPVFISDILSHPNWAKSRGAVLQSGLRAAWSTPITSHNGNVLGTFCMYYREVRLPCQSEIQLIEYASRIAGAAIRWYAAGIDIDDRKQVEERTQQENFALREQIDQVFMLEEMVGSSPALKTVLSNIVKVAPTNSTVLITGETGTGKELIARAIHKCSQRAGQAFIGVNCASIPSSLIASELFGHEKGAFTGALQRRQGRFELAHLGTIFLDEIGELPHETQIALLRVLQERQFERVGGNRALSTDVRVIAATNRDLAAAISSGTFRPDLFYRLNVFPIQVPPLRNRKEDIPMLVEYFVKRYAEKARKQISKIDKNTLELCRSYPWPGNIRELQNIIERSVILCTGDTFWIDEAWLSSQNAPRPDSSGPLTRSVQNYEKELIEAALAESNGKVGGPNGAAAKLGVPRSTLDLKIKQLNIKKNTTR